MYDKLGAVVLVKLFEYEAKEIVRKYSIPVPRGRVVVSPDEAEEAARELGGSVAVKSQVLVGRRGLAGGIILVDSPEEAREAASKLLGSSIRGARVEKLLVEEKICFEKEYYLSLTVDRSNRSCVFLVSPMGGVEIEELVREHPEALLKISFSPETGYQPYMARTAARFLGLGKDYWRIMDSIMSSMYRIMREHDAELVEFNPLAHRCGGGLVALDAKIIIDDNSLYRHKEYMELYGRDMSPLEAKARKLGFSYVELDGNIGVICNGAGLTMATMDLILYYGGRPANFLDIGGGASRERVREAVKLVLSNPRVKVLLLNIFGGITRCDEVAWGVVEALRESSSKPPIVVRMLGTNEEEGRRILEENGINVYSEADEAVKKAVELAGEKEVNA